jgi:hypothetical protein
MPITDALSQELRQSISHTSPAAGRVRISYLRYIATPNSLPATLQSTVADPANIHFWQAATGKGKLQFYRLMFPCLGHYQPPERTSLVKRPPETHPTVVRHRYTA